MCIVNERLGGDNLPSLQEALASGILIRRRVFPHTSVGFVNV